MGTTESSEPDLNIAVGFVRMEDFDTLSSYSSFDLNLMEVLVYERADFWNWSSFTLWALAVFTVIYGAIGAAEEDKIFIHTGGGKQALNKGQEATEEDDDESVSSSVSLRRVRRDRASGVNRRNKGGKHPGAVTERTGLLSSSAARGDDDEEDEEDGGDEDRLKRTSSGRPLMGTPPRQHLHQGDKGAESSLTGGGGRAVSWFGLFDDGSGSVGSGNIDPLASSGSVDNDEVTVNSIRSEASAFLLRVKGHIVHTSEHLMDDLEDGPSFALAPLHALLFLLVASGLLLTLYFVDLTTYISLFYLVAAVYCLHTRALLPSLEWGRDTIYKWVFVYDCRNLARDCSRWWEECCMDAGCNEGVPYRLPQMEIDDEEAIYDEETGEVVTESALNHNSRFYVRPTDQQQGMERGGYRARRSYNTNGSTEGAATRAANSATTTTTTPASSASVGSTGSLTYDDGAGSVGVATVDSDLSLYRSDGTLASCGGACVAVCAKSPRVTKAVLTVVSLVSAVLSAVCWYLYPTSTIRWLLQDALAVSVCVFIMGAVQIPNLKVASILLGCAFVYDIFFTTISPLIFGDSIMLSVATGSTDTDATSPLADDENYCEKYPDYDECATSSLPMLLYIPAFWTWDTDSDAMLGLGDIVLPGLLLVWAARYDLRRYGSLYTEKAGNGYFPMVATGYAVGLCLAEITVELTTSGQPALMFIIPCTLGPVLIRSGNSGTLADLWETLPPMKSIGLLLDEQEQELLQNEEGESDIFRTTAMWPWDRDRDRDSDGAGAGAGAGAGGAPDDQSIHSLHGYNLDSAQRVDASRRQDGYSRGFFF
jgi:signal peptide peptidase-like protein 2B